MSTDPSRTLPLLSLRNLVLFPGAVMPVEIGRASSLRLIESLGGKGARVLVGTQKDADIEEPVHLHLRARCVLAMPNACVRQLWRQRKRANSLEDPGLGEGIVTNFLAKSHFSTLSCVLFRLFARKEKKPYKRV